MDKPGFDFSGKVVLVTGATRGLGRRMVEGFARCGASVIVCSQDEAACRATADELAALGVDAEPIAADVSRWESGPELLTRAYARFGKVDVLVNNAGMSPVLRRLTDLDEAGYDTIFDTNTKSTFRLSTLFAERMMEGDGGAIINVSSTAVLLAPAFIAPYAGAKAAVETITQALARAYGPKVRVNALQFGTFRTDLTAGFVDAPFFVKQMEITNPAKRVGSPEEVVGAALYLASDLATYTSGTILKVDGGQA